MIWRMWLINLVCVYAAFVILTGGELNPLLWYGLVRFLAVAIFVLVSL